MKKFNIAFSIAFIAFALFYIYAEVKGAKNPFMKLFNKNQEETSPQEDLVDNETSKDDEKNNEKEKEISGEMFFVVMGVDGDDVKDLKLVKGQRTDTMILTKVSFDTGEIVMMNLPRDTRVNLKGYGIQKLNAGHAFGGSEGALEAIRNFTKLDVRHYVKVDYQAVRSLVNEIGGVEFDVPTNMSYYDPSAKPPLKINLKKGLQTLDGNKAIELLRWRKNSNNTTGGYGDGSDVFRIQTQQNFIKATISQALSFKNLFKLPSILQAVLPNVDTNIPIEKMISAAASAGKLDTEKITTLTLPGGGKYIDGVSYFLADEIEAKKEFKQYFGNYYMGN